MFHVVEKYRVSRGQQRSTFADENNGAFMINRGRTSIFIKASDGLGWEHVSVHCISENKERTPTWAEMCFIKDLFWDEEDIVVQFHPPKSQYINMHKFTLHMWRSTTTSITTPPTVLIGFW